MSSSYSGIDHVGSYSAHCASGRLVIREPDDRHSDPGDGDMLATVGTAPARQRPAGGLSINTMSK